MKPLRSIVGGAAAALILLTASLASGQQAPSKPHIKHDRDVIRFFTSHPRLASTPAGERELWLILGHVVSQLKRSLQSIHVEPSSWLKQAACIRSHEGTWADNTGNGYYGAYQFLLSTWQSAGGTGYPYQASPSEQTYRAYLVWQRDGGSWREWGTRGDCGLD